MKLPEFRTASEQTSGSKSTSMAQAFMSPQLRQQTQRAVAPQHSLTAGQNSAEQARTNAMAKYDVGIEIANGIGATVKIFNAIDEGDQKMASAAASAEYTRTMADFQADEVANAEEVLDAETDTRRWEKFDERYAEKRERTLSDIRARYKFSGKEREFNFNQKVLGADQTYTTNLTSQANASKINRGEAAFYRAAESTEGTQAKIELARDAFDAGYIDERKKDALVLGFRAKDIYDTYDASIQRQGNAGLVDIIEDVEDGSSANASRLTTAQRNELAKDARRQIKANHFGQMQDLYEAGGIRAVAEYIEDMNNAGPEATSTIDEVGHASLISSMGAKLNQYASIERATMAKNEDSARVSLLGRKLTAEDITSLNTGLTGTEKKRMDAEFAPAVAEMPPEVFYSAEREQYVPVDNMAIIGFVSASVKRRIEKDLSNTSNQGIVLSAANMMVQLKSSYPDAADDFSSDAMDKAEYFVDANNRGIPLMSEGNTGAVQDWETIRKYTPEQKRDLRDRSSAYIATNPDIVSVLAKEVGAVDRDFWSPADAPVENDVFNQKFSKNFHHYFQVTGGQEALAGKLAMQATMRTMGATTRYGTSEPIWEENSPEARLNNGKPSEWIDEQFNDQLAEINAVREENSLATLSPDEVRLEYKSDDVWYVVTPDGQYVTDGNSRKGMEFLKTNPEVQKIRDERLHDDNVSQSNARVNAQVANASVELVPAKFAPQPNASFESQSAANSALWTASTDAEKTEANINYRMAYDQLMQTGIEDLSIRYYLNAQGYMHGDENNDYVEVPDAASRP